MPNSDSRRAGSAWLVALLGVGCVLSPHSAFAVLGDPTPDTARTWGVRDGLPSGAVRDMAQTPDGRVWIATERGLATHDGQKILPLDPQVSQRLSEVVALAAVGEQGLWIAPPHGEPLCLRDQKLTDCLPEGHRIDRPVSIVDLEAGADGSVWFAAEDLVYVFAAGALNWLSSIPDEIGAIRAIHVDGRGRVWIGGSGGLFLRDEAGEIVPYPGATRLASTGVQALRAGKDGAVLVAAPGMVLRFSDSGETILRAPGTNPMHFTSVLEDRDGNVWAAGSDGLLRWESGNLDAPRRFVGPDSGLPADELTTLLEDRAGALWIGTRSAGIVRLGSAMDTTPPGSLGWPTVLGAALGLGGLVLLLSMLWSSRWRRSRSNPAARA